MENIKKTEAVIYAVQNYKGHYRYFKSKIKAEITAKSYGTCVCQCFKLPRKGLIED